MKVLRAQRRRLDLAQGGCLLASPTRRSGVRSRRLPGGARCDGTATRPVRFRMDSLVGLVTRLPPLVTKLHAMVHCAHFA